MALMEWTVVHLPVAEGWTGQPAYERVFGSGWRIILASMAAFFVGDFLNSVVLAKMKIWTNGKHLWTRTIGSTIVGEGADSLIFYPLAFYGMSMGFYSAKSADLPGSVGRRVARRIRPHSQAA